MKRQRLPIQLYILSTPTRNIFYQSVLAHMASKGYKELSSKWYLFRCCLYRRQPSDYAHRWHSF